MQKFLRTLTLVALFAMPWVMQGQNAAKVSEYDGEVTRATYTSIASNATKLALTNGTATVQMEFPMSLGENTVADNSNVTVYGNGCIEFTSLANSGVAPLMFAAYTSGNVYYTHTATEMVFEWRKVVDGDNSYSFQLALHSTGNIEFRYGPMTLNVAKNVYVGLMSSNTDIFRVHTVNSRWDTVVRATDMAYRSITNDDYYAASHMAYNQATREGVVYTFTQPACGKPGALTVSAPKWDSIYVSWEANAGVSKYEVYVTTSNVEPTDATTGTIVLATTPGVQLTGSEITGYHVGGLSGNTPYYVYVRKYCGNTASGWRAYSGTVTTPASCPSPYASNFSLSEAGIASWTLTNYPNIATVDIYYSQNNVAPGENTEPTFSVAVGGTNDTNLAARADIAATSATTWYVWFRGRCTVDGGTTLAWTSSAKSFTTPCGAMTIPYTMDFEDGNLNCWEVLTGTSYNSTSTPHNGSRCLQFVGSTDNYVAMPLMSQSYATLTLSFWERNEGSSSGQFAVGYMTDLTDVSTFHSFGEYTRTGAYTYHEIDLATANIPAGAYIVFRQYNCSDNWYWFLDDVQVQRTPNCDKATGLAISADKVLSWTAGNTTKWQVRYKKSTDESYAYRIVENTPSVTLALTGAAGTQYEIAVRSICGADDTLGWSDNVTYTMPLSLPYTNDFEDGMNGFATFNGGTNAWYRGTAAKKDGDYGFYISNNGGTSNAYSHGSMQTYGYVVLPFATAGTYQVNFDWKTNSGDNGYDMLRVALIPDANALPTGYDRYNLPTGSIDVGGGNLQAQSTWKHVSNDVEITTPGNYKLTFIWCNDGSYGSGAPAAIDNVSVIALTCPAPTDFNVTSTGVATWTASNNAHHYQLYVGPSTATEPVEADTISLASGETIPGLLPETQYKAWLRSFCAADDQSDWVGPVSFTTPETCMKPTALNATPGTGNDATTADLSWTEGTGANNPTSATGEWQIQYWKSGSNDAITVIATTKPFTLTNLEMGTAYTWMVRTVCQAGDTSKWSIEGSFNTQACLSAEAGNPITIGTKNTTSNSSSSNVGTVPLNTYYYRGTSNQIYTAAEVGGAATLSSITFTLAASAQKTFNWDIYLMETDKSSFASNTDWILPTTAGVQQVFSGTVTTPSSAGTLTIPFDNLFNYSGAHNLALIVVNPYTGNYTSSTQFDAYTVDGVTNCAISYGNDNIDVTSSTNGIRTNARNVVTFGTVTCDQGTCLPPTVAIEQGVSGDFGTATLTFTAPDANTTNFGYKYGPQGFNPATEGTAGTANTTEATAVINGLNGSSTYDIYVYSVCNEVAGRMVRYQVTIPFIPTCKVQTDFDTNAVSYTGATVTWKQEDTTQVPQKWLVRYATSSFDPATDAVVPTYEVTTPSYTISGLHNGDHVYLYTKADCGTDGESPNWSAFDFQLPAVPAPQGITSWNTTNISDSLRWTDLNGTVNYPYAFPIASWTVRYATADFDPTDDNANFDSVVVNSTRIKLTDLEPATTYYVYVRTNGTATEHSAWTPATAHTFTTLCPYGGEVIVGNMESTSTDSYVPMQSNYNYSYAQMIYTADEIGGATTIYGISFYEQGTVNVETPVTLYVAETDKETFSSNTDFIAVDELTQVFDGNYPTNTSGWHKIDFDTPFDFSGNHNLVVAFYNHRNEYSSGVSHRYTATTKNTCIYNYDDGSGLTPDNPTYYYNGSKSVSTHRPNVKFITPCETTVTCFAPKNFAAAIDSSNNVKLTWTKNTDMESDDMNGCHYVVAYGPTAEFGNDIEATAQNVISNIAADSLIIAGSQLTADVDYTFYVRTDCGEGNYSPNWQKVTKTTWPDVFAPISLSATLPNSNSTDTVKLTWTEKNPEPATAWQIAYGPAGFDPYAEPATNNVYTVAPVSTTTPGLTPNGRNVTYFLGGLKHSTKYEFYVLAVKGNDMSLWSTKASATTACGEWTMADLPIEENFDSYSTGNTLPNCWSKIASSASRVAINGSYYSSGNRSLYLAGYKDCYAVLPELAATVHPDSLTLAFNARFSNVNGKIFVGVMTSKTDKSTFDTVATVTPSAANSWESFQISLADFANHAKHAGHTDTWYVAIADSNLGVKYIDDVVLKVTEPTDTLPNASVQRDICGMYIIPTRDDNNNYTAAGEYTYTLTPEAGKVLHITGSYDLEYGYDYLSLYRGSVAPANLIATYTGNGNDIDYKTGSNLWADSGAVVLVFKTDEDNAMNYEGFKLFVKCECPDVCDTIQIVTVETHTSYTWTAPQGNGVVYDNIFTRANGTDLLVTEPYTQRNISGECDSINKELHLTVHPAYKITYANAEICERDTFHLNNDGMGFYGQFHTISGNYSDTLHTAFGADSIGVVAIQMNVAPKAYIYNNSKQLGDTVNGWCDYAEMVLEARADRASTFEWNDGTMGVYDTVTPHLSGTYTVVATDNQKGCTSLPVSVTVNTTPVADLTVSASDTVICRGESTTLTLADANNVDATYRWTNNRTSGVLTGASITVTPDSTTTYTVTATTNNTSKCQTSATFTVTVNQLPEVLVSTSVSSSCRDSLVTLIASEKEGYDADGYTYLWSNNATTATAAAYPSATGSYTLTVTETATGCSNSFTTASVTVYPSYTVIDTMTLCFTQNPYTWGEQTLSADGDYTQNFKIAHGCDSLVYLNLAFRNMSTINSYRELCEETPYTWGGNAYTAHADTTVHYVSTPVDCPVDSVLNLTVNYPAASSFDKTVCDSYTWVIDTNTIGTYTTTGAYSTTLQTNKGCDSVVTVNLTVNYQNTGVDVQNVCDELEWIDGIVYDEDNDSAQYTLANQWGCDSVVTLNLTLRHATVGDTAVKECDHHSYTWVAMGETIGTYNLTDVSGNISHTWKNANAAGCDTTARLLLTMNDVKDTLNWAFDTVRDVYYLNTVDCDGDTVEKDYRYSQDVEERIHNAQLNRDEWFRLHLTVNTSINRTDRRTECVPYVFGLIHGMDTVTGEHFVVNKDDYDSTRLNDTLFFLNLEDKSKGYHEVGVYNEDAYVSFNLDELGYRVSKDTSVIYWLRLTAKQHDYENLVDTICENGYWKDPNYTAWSNFDAGKVVFEWDRKLGKAANGCDSVFMVDLLVNPIYMDSVAPVFCESEFVLDTVTTSPSYNQYVKVVVNPIDASQTWTLTIPGDLNQVVYEGRDTAYWRTAMGCDSTMIFKYTVNPTLRETVADTACLEYTWVGHDSFKTLTDSGTYVDTIVSMVTGCDSIVTLNLMIYDTVKLYDTLYHCTEYEVNGEKYRTTKTFDEVIGTSKFGCDTVLYSTHVIEGMQIVVNNVITNLDTFPWHGVKYAASVDSVLYDAGTNINGCDSLELLNLTMLDSIELCRNQLPYTMPDLGIVLQPFPGAAGAYFKHDATVRNLINDTLIVYFIKELAVKNDTMTACDSLVWWTDSVYTVSGDYTKFYPAGAPNGCDSTETLHLTVNYSNTGILDTAACLTWTWNEKIVNGQPKVYTESNNTDTIMLKNAAGCDSTVTLNLTIKPRIFATDIQVACDSLIWVVNNDTVGTYYASTNEPKDTLFNAAANGCDSVVTLNLTINTNVKQVTYDTLCQYAAYAWTVTNNDLYDTLLAFAADYFAKSDTMYSFSEEVTDVNGCDVFDSLYLTVYPRQFSKDTIVINEPSAYYKNYLFTAPFDSDTLTNAVVADLFVDTLTSVRTGCDSVAFHRLVLKTGNMVDDSVFACGRYTWMNNHTYQWIPASERVNPMFAYKDITTDEYIYENPKHSTFINDTIDKTYVLWLSIAEAAMADSVYASFPLSQETLTIGDSTWDFSAYKAAKKDTVVKKEIHFGSTYYCDSIEYWTINLKYNYDTIDTTYLCYSDSLAAGKAVNTVFLVNDTTAKGTDAEMITTTPYVRMADFTMGDTTATACGQFTWYDSTFTASTDSATHILQVTRHGVACDSIVKINLTIKPLVYSTDIKQACDSLLWHDSTYTASTDSAKYTVTRSYADGCDSIVTLNLTIKNTVYGTDIALACDSLKWHDSTYTASTDSAKYTVVRDFAHGCDSIVTLNLTINHPTTGDTTALVCDSFDWYEHVGLTTDSTLKHNFEKADMNGCDSIVTLHLTVHYSSDTTIDTVKYRGGSYRLHEQLFVAPITDSIVDFVLTNVAGCDSVVRYHLWVTPYDIVFDNEVACGLFTWTVNGHTYQWISDAESAAHGDAFYKDITADKYVMTWPKDTVDNTVRYLNLTLNEALFGDTTVARFPLSQDSLVLGNDTFYFAGCQAGDTNVWFSAGHNYYCDSLVYATIHMVFDYDTVEDVVCNTVKQYAWNGKNWAMDADSATGKTYYFRDTLNFATDSEQVRTMKVYHRAFSGSAFADSACDSYTWMDADTAVTTITTAGKHDYKHTFVDQYGCDSLVTLSLTLYTNSSKRDANVTACDSYTWHGRVYDSVGTVTDTFSYTTAHGCYSVDTITITINKNYGKDTTVVACDSYTWYGTTYTLSPAKGYVTHDSVDANTCHHMDTLWLTINHKQIYDSLVYSGEGSYRHNGVLYTSDTNFFDTLNIKTVNGCDSIYKVQLHFGLYHYATDDTIVCSEYTWRNGHTYQWISTEEGTAHNALYYDATDSVYVTYMPMYIQHIADDYDSVYTLNLTLTQRFNGYDDTTFFVSNKFLAYGDSIFDFTMEDSLAYNVLGFNDTTVIRQVTYLQPVVKHYCDSVITLNVNLKNNYVSVGDTHICDVETITWRGKTYDTKAKTEGNIDVAYDWYLYDTIAATGMIEYVHVYQHPVAYTTDRRTVCDSLRWIDGNLYTESRSDITFLTHTDSVRGYCDSVVSLVLIVNFGGGKNDSVETECGAYTWTAGDGREFTYNASIDTMVTYTNTTNNCQAYDTLHFVYHQVYTNVIAADTACDEYVWKNAKIDGTDTTITKTGTYKHTFKSQFGCDSTVTLNLVVNHNSDSIYLDTTFAGDTNYVWERNGMKYTEAGKYAYEYNALSGCPSVDSLFLTMENGVKDVIVACDTFRWHNVLYTVDSMTVGNTADTFFYVNKSVTGKNLGQDTLVLTLNTATHNVETVAACKTYTWHGQNVTNNTGKTLLDTLTYDYSNGVCASVDTLFLTLGTGRTFVFDEQTSCGPYTWVINGDTIGVLTESMETSVNVPTATGCDSVVSLTLTVKYAPVVDTFATTCNNKLPFEWRGYELTESGDTSVTFELANECDSTITLHLTVNDTVTTELTDQVCLGNGYNANGFDIDAADLAKSGEYTFTLRETAVNGCDSIVTLTLTVGTVLTGDTSAVACDQFNWYGEIYDTTGDYTYKTATLSGCDSIVTLHLTINVNEGVETSVTSCDSYMWFDELLTESNTYHHAFADANGCVGDSVLNLTITTSNTGDTTAVACDYFVWQGQTYSQSGDYVYTFENVSECDSVVTLHLTVNSSKTTTIDTASCGSFTWNDAVYSISGSYTVVFEAANGCDSTVTMNLTVKDHSIVFVEDTACDSYTWTVNGTVVDTYTASTTDFALLEGAAANGCDSIITLNLTVNYSTHNAEDVSVCDSYDWNGMTLTESCDTVYRYTNMAGCASVDTLHLTIRNSTNNAETVSACISYDWNGETYTTSGDKLYYYTNLAGCASVDTLHLTINQPVTGDTVAEACNAFTWYENTLTESGTATHTFVAAAANGCDSVVTLTFTLKQAVYNTVSAVACDSYEWHGRTFTESTDTATYTTIAANGCDSIVTLNLTINESYNVTLPAVTACESYDWNEQTYTTSGNYTHRFVAVNGCDSTVVLPLTINVPTDSTVYEEACRAITWHDQTCNASGLYYYTTTNAAGCDSVVTLVFTLKQAVYNTVSAVACDSYEWHGRTFTESTDTATYTTIAANGCDSIVTLHLTVNESYNVTLPAVTACSSYEWNGQTYTTSDNYTLRYVAENGCDSLVTLPLTINLPTTGDTTAVACEEFTWYGTTYTTSTTDTRAFTAANGCDSVVTLNLTINQPVYNNVEAAAVGSYSWNGTTYTESGDYTYNFEGGAANGCDSIVILTLDITPVYTVTLTSANETMGTVSESGTIAENGYWTATATANEGYEFVAWMNGNDTASTNSTYVFQVTEDVTLTAIFKVKVGINDVDMNNVTIYSADTRIFVRGAEGYDVYVYDVNGRTIARQSNAADAIEFRMATTGVYLVKVGNAPAKRVIVVR